MAEPSAQGGFTLLEMIVVVVVLGFLMVGLTEGSRFGFTAWKHQADIIADHDQFDAVDRALRLLLTQAQEFRGGAAPDELIFTGTLPAAAALGTHRADMDLLVDDNHRLILKWTPKRHETPLHGQQPPTTTVLLSGVGRIDVSYWHGGDADNNGQGQGGNSGQAGGSGQAPAPQPSVPDQVGWNDELTAGETPKLIKLTLSFPAGDRRIWPPIVVAPAALGPGEQNPAGANQ